MGAWIETITPLREFLQVSVASYMGAGSETKILSDTRGSTKKVASYMGAWIETDIACNACHVVVSHPTWVRGLKHN